MKDPKATKSPRSISKNRYPVSPIAEPSTYKESSVTDSRTYISNPMSYQNKEMAAEDMMARSMFYNNVDPRRKQELSDSRMIQEDHSAVANLSRTFQNHTFDANEFPERLAMYNQSTKAKR
jgi:hypothetical protein